MAHPLKVPRRRWNAPGPAQEVEAPMHQKRSSASRRPAGTGSLFTRRDVACRESWYGKVWAGCRQVKRKLGPKREPGGSVGLTQRQAEHTLHELVAALRAAPPAQERLSFATAAERYVRHVDEVRQRRATTVRELSPDGPKAFRPLLQRQGSGGDRAGFDRGLHGGQEARGACVKRRSPMGRASAPAQPQP